MDINEFLVVGDRVDVELDDNFYRTIVQDIPTNETCLLSQLIRRNIPVYVRPGSEVRVTFSRSNGLFHFPVRMEGYLNLDGQVMMRMSAMGYPVKQQRRNSFRLEIRLPVYIQVLPENPNDPEAEIEEIKSSVLDISEGGMRIALLRPLQAETRLNCEVVLHAAEPAMELEAVVRYILYPEAPQDSYKAGLEFVGLAESKRRTIGRYIISQQAKNRR